jgi:hypothetical protein
VIDTLNGQTFPDFTTFYKRIMQSDAPITVLADKEGVKLAIDNVEAKKYNDEILKRYAIAKAKSEDLEGR